jgi:Ca2+/H+ antiporter, TMEM165/GDT1 family
MPLGLSAAEFALIGATFLASAVEIVEAYTIVLAMGLTRGWRSAGAGAVAALVLLAVLTVVAGYTILRLIPPSLLQLVIGTLLLIFGMQWLRKAVLRSAGRKALHDEDAIYATEVEAARAAPVRTLFGLDWFAFVVAFKGVLLEGLEVVVIVLTFGISAGNIPLAAVGALLAIVPVTILVIVVRGPLSRVPENSIKFVVGLLLTTFGTFWATEGLGVFAPDSEALEWPGGEVALLVVLAAWTAFALIAVRLLRRSGSRRATPAEVAP